MTAMIRNALAFTPGKTRKTEVFLNGAKDFSLRFSALLAAFLLLFSCAFAETGEEDIDLEDDLVEWEDLDEDNSGYAADVFYHTPNEHSEVKCDHEVCFWKMEEGRLDEEAVWKVLTQPVTVLKGKQREQILVLARPDKDCKDYVGVVTCASQAVHVLREEGDWTLIEAYSSAEEGSRSKVFAEQFQGYVKTSLLKEEEVDDTYGLVIDKLKQRLYVFKEGKLFSTLVCSTGFAKEGKPFHETPAGEFLVVSWAGGFWSDGNLWCDMGMRINSGILLHEVPCRYRTDERTGETVKDYSRCERYLGEKASHGCIRIQKEKAPEGVNAKWLWDNLSRKPYTKVIIWDDLDRELGYPDDDLILYYNPGRGENYHSGPTCSMVLSKYEPMTPFTYGELEEKPYAGLGACPGCAPQPRKEKIDKLNSQVRKED